MKYLFLLTGILLYLTACSEQDAITAEQPDPVRVVYKFPGADTTATEPGIDAVSQPGEEMNGIQLMWHKREDLDQLSRYRIFRSQHETGRVNFNLTAEITSEQSAFGDTIFIDTQDLQLNVRYYYYMTVMNTDDQESNPSDTVSYMLLEKATLLSVNGNASTVSAPEIRFEWWLNSGETPDQYILRMEQFVSEQFHPVVYIDYIQSSYQVPQFFTLAGDSLLQQFGNGKYRWRIDCVGADDFTRKQYSGSESDWAFFTINWDNS